MANTHPPKITELHQSSQQLIFVGGKGGTGKTTLSLAIGYYLSKKYRTLVISTDPAHSLAHALQLKKENAKTPSSITETLSVLELDAEQYFEEFKQKHNTEILQLFESTTYLDKTDINQLISLTLPGIDELMAFRYIARLLEKGEWEKIIVDTAPTGHTLRLLSIPNLIDDWVKVMAKIRWKYRYVKKVFTPKSSIEDDDDLLLDLKKTTLKLKNLLRDKEKAEFIMATKAEPIVMEETIELLQQLRRFELSVKHIIVNNAMPSHYRSNFCKTTRERQKQCIEMLKNELGNTIDISFAWVQPQGILGLEQIKNFSELLFNGSR